MTPYTPNIRHSVMPAPAGCIVSADEWESNPDSGIAALVAAWQREQYQMQPFEPIRPARKKSRKTEKKTQEPKAPRVTISLREPKQPKAKSPKEKPPRICHRCGVEFPATAFIYDNGKGYRVHSTFCPECRLEKAAEAKLKTEDAKRKAKYAKRKAALSALPKPMPTEKICNTCYRLLPVESFYRSPAGKLFYQCRECQKVHDREMSRIKREKLRALRPPKPPKPPKVGRKRIPEGDTRVCHRCRQELPIEAFPWKVKAKGRHSCLCKECTRIYVKEFRDKKKDERDKDSDQHC